MIERLILETKIQSFLDHPNICKLYGIFDDQQYVYMVMEYMQSGSLYSEMKKKKKLAQKETSSIVENICSAVAEIHRNCIIHRDIKPQNIVISMGVYKLCDFGWSVVENERR